LSFLCFVAADKAVASRQFKSSGMRGHFDLHLPNHFFRSARNSRLHTCTPSFAAAGVLILPRLPLLLSTLLLVAFAGAYRAGAAGAAAAAPQRSSLVCHCWPNTPSIAAAAVEAAVAGAYRAGAAGAAAPAHSHNLQNKNYKKDK